MGDICISLSAVKSGFLPAAEALNRNGDDKVCKSENPKISYADFEAFVNIVKITPKVKVVPAIKIPEMVVVSKKLSIMKGEVTAGLFKLVMKGYKITGHNAKELQSILDDPSKTGKVLTYVSLEDAREFAKRLSDLTGRQFRVQTEEEWKQAREQLSGNNWTWTETKYEELSGSFVVRHLDGNGRNRNFPERRFNYYAVRLVEDR